MGFEGEVKLSDFSVAKAAGLIGQNESKQLSGTPGYMSPEQANYEIRCQRPDIFSNGVVVADLLLSKNMFAGSGVSESCQKIIDLRLDAVSQKTLAHDLEIRYDSAERLTKDFEYHMYQNGYGPTNETLARYMSELLPDNVPA